MFLLNLTLPQFLALFGALSAGVVALYLLDRSRRKQVVATLRFWVASEKAAQVRHRKRIQQPLSLVLQLLGIALLLLALGQLRWGTRGPTSRNHVLILDTSAWMAARSGNATLMDEARAAAHAYLDSLPGGDRVMIVRADALSTPATVFESNRTVLKKALEDSRPGFTALNLQQAVSFARHAQVLQGGRGGEIVFAGSNRIPEDEVDVPLGSVPRFRVLTVPDRGENLGIRQVGMRRSASDPDVWEVLVGVRNYGAAARTAPLVAQFGGAIVATDRVTLPPNSERNASFQFRTRVGGMLQVRLAFEDALPDDNQAVLEAPPQRMLRVLVCSEHPDLLRPVLSANPHVVAVYQKPSEYVPGAARSAAADILVLDEFVPKPLPDLDTIWVAPPADGSPLRVRTVRENAPLTLWRSNHPLGAGLRAKDLRLDTAEVFEPAPDDTVIAESDGAPIIVARAGKRKSVFIGFHPGRAGTKYELATPLLFANMLRWMAPDIFRRQELNAGHAGTVSIPIAPDTDPASLKVVAADGAPLPFTIQGRNLRFFAGTPGTVRVIGGDTEQVYSLTLPEVAEGRWEAPKTVRHGIPPAEPAPPPYADLWPWLALAAALCFAAEWLLFGGPKMRRARRAPELQQRDRPEPAMPKVAQ